MQIYIRDLLLGEIITSDVESTDTIDSIKQKIKEKNGFYKYFQILAFSNERLEDNKTLEDYKIQENSSIFLVKKLGGYVVMLYMKVIVWK